MSIAPTLDYEHRFLGSGARLLAGIDEVGRGAIAGPVTVGIAVVDLSRPVLLDDVRDSKLLKEADRERLEPLVRSWSVASAVGHASAGEIDAMGIIAALRTAGTRAWLQILAAGVTPDVVLLDGSHNWLSPETQASLFDDAPAGPGLRRAGPHPRQGGHAVPERGRRQHPRQGGAGPADADAARRSTRPSPGMKTKATARRHTRRPSRPAGPTPYHRVSWQIL